MAIQLHTMQEFAKLRLPYEPWLVPGLLPGTGWTLLMAPSKVGKSILALQLAEALASGQDFIGFKTVAEKRGAASLLKGEKSEPGPPRKARGRKRIDSEIEGEMDREIDRDIDRQMDRQIEGEIDQYPSIDTTAQNLQMQEPGQTRQQNGTGIAGQAKTVPDLRGEGAQELHTSLDRPWRRVLYVQADAPPGDWQEQIRALAPGCLAWTVTGLQAGFLGDPIARRALRNLAAGIKAELLIWDALYKLGVWDLNSPDGILAIGRHLRGISSAPYLLIHHPAKWSVQAGGQGAGTYAAAGSFALASDASAVWTLARDGLSVTGRNVPTRTIALTRDDDGRWVGARETGRRHERTSRSGLTDLLDLPA